MERIAVIYDRASREEQSNNWSRDDARRVGTQLAERHSYNSELRQEVESGETLEHRPVMLRILDDIKTGKVGAIVVQDFTRLSRDQDGIDGRIIRSICREHDCKVITPSKTYDFSLDADDDMADFNFLVGKIHKRQTVKALVRGMKEKARQGKQLTGFTLMGYTRVYDPPEKPGERPIGRMIVHEEEAEVVRLLYRKYLDLRSGRGTARWLNQNGYRKPVKSKAMQERYELEPEKPFNQADVIRTIKNPLYAGWATWGKDCDSRHLRDFDEQWVFRPKLQIVSQDTWDRANELRKRNSYTPARAITTDYAFSLLLACESCGGTMVGTSVKKSTRRWKKYRCSRRSKAGGTVCQKGQVIYETVVSRALIPVAADLLERGLDLDYGLNEAARGMSRDVDDDLERQWKAELAQADREISNVVRAIANGVITDTQAKEVMNGLKAKKSRLERNLTQVQEKAKVRQDLLDAIPAIAEDVENTLWTLFKNQPTTLNEILKLVFERNSVVVESWGPNSNKSSRVAKYELTQAFKDAMVRSTRRSRRPSKHLAR